MSNLQKNCCFIVLLCICIYDYRSAKCGRLIVADFILLAYAEIAQSVEQLIRNQ